MELPEADVVWGLQGEALAEAADRVLLSLGRSDFFRGEDNVGVEMGNPCFVTTVGWRLWAQSHGQVRLRMTSAPKEARA